MTSFSVSSFLDKTARVLLDAADKDIQSSQQKEKLANIALDQNLQRRIDGVIAQAVLLGADVLDRVQDAFDGGEAPAPEPTPQPDQPKTEQPKPEAPSDRITFHSIPGANLPPEILEALNRLFGPDGTKGL